MQWAREHATGVGDRDVGPGTVRPRRGVEKEMKGKERGEDILVKEREEEILEIKVKGRDMVFRKEVLEENVVMEVLGEKEIMEEKVDKEILDKGILEGKVIKERVLRVVR